MPDAAIAIPPRATERRLPGARLRRFVPWALLALAIAAPFLLSAYNLNLLARFMAMAILALGLVLIWGHGGILSLGQGVFFGLGGYAIAMHMKLADLPAGELPDFMVWSGRESLPFWWQPFASPAFTLAAILIVPALVAALFAWAVFHRRVGGTYFALITQALALAFATLLTSRQDVTGGFNGLTDFYSVFGFGLSRPAVAKGLYWVTLAILCLAFIGLRLLLASRFGMLLRAVRDGENRARFLGYSPTPFKVVAFAIAGLLAGVAGALFTLHAGVVAPALVGVVPSIEMVVWVAIGGRYSLAGAILGALAVNLARDGISSAMPELWLYLIGALFILVVTLLPNGLAGFARARFGGEGRA
ncbi:MULTISPECIES: urea ABC transporter permease subunit UrtC [Sphingomonadales]|uniref:Urea ABC transporter permease subunit UrtC n=2 Tax=Edaphosphingomonas TaxID=3423724 RepID=A0A2T4HNE7_9SPHN|nr:MULTISPECIES: urea ABC transporter permease subunit UrtC [Sphingomonas]AGH49174.1 urea ABC transporter permease UrtC [Sphingomonas sp. MM-1]MDX3884343.1 urea ABC transporter permease subunit UrtC [Sphingomonas sp.]OHT21826.1 leucine/isoleucine/valine transporter permease subunit [Sphingomonas haloaromaticamans]PTD17325.1 urea ABC transporter permease subunit UrtC [Sphingomonas fennica]